MAQWKFHVILPNGDEYLTETLAEARALEAQYGRSAHLPMRQRVEENPRKPAATAVAAPAEQATRRTPQRFVPTEEVTRDPRLPPVGTVLAKQGLVVVFDQMEGTDVFHVVAPTRKNMRGTYMSLSGLVRKFLNVSNYNGFQFFGLLERMGGNQGRYQVAQVGANGLAIARQDHDTPVEAYAATEQEPEETLVEEIAPEPAPPASGKTPLYGYDSEHHAYLVDDYPYGYRTRTQIRYWLESHPRNGFRFVSQTLNPRSGRWNAPNKSTYALLGGQMFLDADGHVQWEGVTEYTDADKLIQFLRHFPKTDTSRLPAYVRQKVLYYTREARLNAEGRTGWTMNGQPIAARPGDLERSQQQLAEWQQVESLLTKRNPYC